jgi:hypothetical protein
MSNIELQKKTSPPDMKGRYVSSDEVSGQVLHAQDFYAFAFCSTVIDSMCGVLGNRSKGMTVSTRYFSLSTLIFLARVAGLHET